jgi:hypothetical protein
MLFISTPSLIISMVLAVFYVANVAIYTINRYQDTVHTAKIEDVRFDNESCKKYTTLISSHQEVIKYSFDIKYQTFTKTLYSQLTSLRAMPFPMFNYYCEALPGVTPSILHSGFCWKLFSRPPPAGSASVEGYQKAFA